MLALRVRLSVVLSHDPLVYTHHAAWPPLLSLSLFRALAPMSIRGADILHIYLQALISGLPPLSDALSPSLPPTTPLSTTYVYTKMPSAKLRASPAL